MKSREFYPSGGTRRGSSNPAKNSDDRPSGSGLASPQLSNRVQLLARPREDERNRVGSSAPIIPTATQRPRENDDFHNKQRHRGGVVISTRPAPASAPVVPGGTTRAPEMIDAKKLIGESMSFEEFIAEYLTDNSNFSVVGAIGPQGAGKSTILSMLGGNESDDLYRHYVFRPASREAVESSRFQTMKIYAYVSKSRKILIDCQATNCASLLDDSFRHSRIAKLDERAESHGYVECIQLVAFLLQICQTLLVCSDFAVDLQLFKIVRTAEMLRASIDNVTTQGLPELNHNRKVNLVFLHTRARSADYSSLVRGQRAALIRAMFVDSRRVRISDNNDLVIMCLPELKPRKDTITMQMQHGGREGRHLDNECCEDFASSIRRLRISLPALPRDPFSQQTFTEKHWLTLARIIWRDPTFLSAVDKFTAAMSKE